VKIGPRQRLSKLFHRQKQTLRRWAYPLQRGLPLSFAEVPDREAIMMFDASTRYGGWIDRVKGIISVYELAQLTSRKLRVYAGPTFPLGDFLQPATFDWRTTLDELAWNPLATEFHVSRDRPSPEFQVLRDSHRRRLYIETNIDYLPQLHSELQAADVHQLWGQRFRELFALKTDFAAEVAAYKRSSAVALHARFTSLLGDFTDVVEHQLDEARRAELLEQCLDRVRKVASMEAGPVIVFSDSPTFLREAQRVAANVLTLPGTPAHIDHTHEARESLRKTLLDFYVMLSCERIILLRLGPMYRSKFSRYAAYISGAPFSELT
jgi:hypothetical protein